MGLVKVTSKPSGLARISWISKGTLPVQARRSIAKFFLPVDPQPQHLPQLNEQARWLRLRQFTDGLLKDILVQQLQSQPCRHQRQRVLARLDNVQQEGIAGGGVQFARMTFAVKNDEGGEPTRQGFDPRLGLPGGTGGGTELIEQSRRLRRGR